MPALKELFDLEKELGVKVYLSNGATILDPADSGTHLGFRTDSGKALVIRFRDGDFEVVNAG